jgi:23S rRNA pseudouridine1911/1915/1917 synthase
MAGDTLNLRYEDNHLLVAVKAAGQLSQGDESGNESLPQTLKSYIKEKYGKPGAVYLGLVHRLDRPVGGLMVFARTSKAASRLSSQFRLGETEKYYLAWVHGSPKNQETLKHRIGREEKKAILDPNGQEALLRYKRIWQLKDRSLLLIKLDTGRHHQIRLQCSAEGFPIIGDTLYGGPPSWKQGEIALFCWALAFYHPTKKEKLSFRIMPPSMWQIPHHIETYLMNAAPSDLP